MELPYNLERPQFEQSTSYIWIIAAILIGTTLLLILIKHQKKVVAMEIISGNWLEVYPEQEVFGLGK